MDLDSWALYAGGHLHLNLHGHLKFNMLKSELIILLPLSFSSPAVFPVLGSGVAFPHFLNQQPWTSLEGFLVISPPLTKNNDFHEKTSGFYQFFLRNASYVSDFPGRPEVGLPVSHLNYSHSPLVRLPLQSSSSSVLPLRYLPKKQTNILLTLHCMTLPCRRLSVICCCLQGETKLPRKANIHHNWPLALGHLSASSSPPRCGASAALNFPPVFQWKVFSCSLL